MSSDVIVVGSFAGVLRIFNPTSSGSNNAADVILEQQLDQAILQVAIGKFIPYVVSLLKSFILVEIQKTMRLLYYILEN